MLAESQGQAPGNLPPECSEAYTHAREFPTNTWSARTLGIAQDGWHDRGKPAARQGACDAVGSRRAICHCMVSTVSAPSRACQRRTRLT